MKEIPEAAEIRKASESSSEYADELAQLLRDQAVGLYLSGTFRHSGMQQFGHKVSTKYLANLIDSVYPGLILADLDPILRMRAEQTVLLHHQIGVLYTEGTSEKSVEERKIVLSMVSQLLGEFRRLSTQVRDDLAALLADRQFNSRSDLKVRGTSESDAKEGVG